MTEYDIIELYKNMKSLHQICKKEGIDQANLTNRRLKDDDVKKITKIIKLELFSACLKILSERW